MHRILQRQVRKIFGESPELTPEVKRLLEAVDETYQHFDEDRKLIERSLELSSKELVESNRKLREEVETATKKAQELEEMNELMVDRELRMIELKQELEKNQKKAEASESLPMQKPTSVQ